jgi:amino acid transporter
MGKQDMATVSEKKRIIGFWGATNIGVGGIVGGGILALAGVAFAMTGPSAIMAFLLNAVIAFITALSFAQMSITFPESGGAYTFTKKVFSARSAFSVGWILWFASLMAGLLYAMGFAFYAADALQTLWHAFSQSPPAWLSSYLLVIILSIGAVAAYTIKLTFKTSQGSQWETIGKVLVFFILTVGGLIILPKHSISDFKVKLSPFFAGGMIGFFQAMGFTFITFQGFDLISAVAGEVKEPGQIIPRAMYTSLAVALIIYIPFLFIIATAGIPAGQSITVLSRQNTETIVAVAVKNYLGTSGYWLIIVAAILSMLSALYANLLAAAHIAYTMSQDWTLPRFLGIVRKESGIPVRALYMSSIILILCLIFIHDLASAGAAASLVFLISFILVHITNILARWRIQQIDEGIRHNIKPYILPAIGIVCCGSLALFQGILVPAASEIIIIWFILGILFYYFFLQSRAAVVDVLAEAKDPHLVKLRGRSPLVLVPIANPSRAQAMVEVAHALSPPQAGRVLLLSVVTGQIKWGQYRAPQEFLSSQEVLREAMIASYSRGLSPEALVTVAQRPWSEIIRVARLHRCESLLLGLGDTEENKMHSYLERIINVLNSDMVFLKSPPRWDLSAVERILVPVGGKGDHDELRSRLLGSICRSKEREVLFLRIVPQDVSDRKLKWIQYKMSVFAEEETPLHPQMTVIRSNDIISTIKEHTNKSDLVVLGLQRFGRRKKFFGSIELEIVYEIPAATILISRKG